MFGKYAKNLANVTLELSYPRKWRLMLKKVKRAFGDREIFVALSSPIVPLQWGEIDRIIFIPPWSNLEMKFIQCIHWRCCLLQNWKEETIACPFLEPSALLKIENKV